MQWKPPPRPQWVDYLNKMGDAIGGAAALASIDAEELINTARRTTGLKDFGPEDWQQPFAVLVDAINGEAQLNAVGQIMTRTELLRALQNRLRIEEAIRRDPGILSQPVVEPVFICGLARSGTSITQELMAQDPRFHVPQCWEVFNSWPAPEADSYLDDPRIAAADAEHLFFEEVVPAYRAMHENGGALPVECIYITAQAFMSIYYAGCLNIPSYNQYLATTDNTPAFEYHKRVLQVLQSRMPGKRWLLKSPNHIDNMDALFSVYPDARIIHTHRDPVKTVPSTLSIMATTTWMRSEKVNLQWAKFLHKALAQSLNRVIERREAGDLPHAQFVDLQFSRLMDAPADALRDVYTFLQLPFDQQDADRIETYLGNKPQAKHGKHHYSMEEFSLDGEKVSAAFDTYRTHYQIPCE